MKHSVIEPVSVSVLVPTYNRANYLKEALEGIVGQKFPPSQILVIDDGSTDSTRDVVRDFGSRVEYIAKDNGGKSSALNVGLRHATGELIWIFDDDDLPEPDVLEKLVLALQRNPDCGFAFGDYDLFTAERDGNVSYSSANLPDVRPECIFLASLERSFVLQQGLLVRRSCYADVGEFDETLVRSQDLDMALRLSDRYRGIKVDGVLFHLRQHSGARGSQASPILANRKVEGWIESDRVIIRRILAAKSLERFIPQELIQGPLTNGQKFSALLQRSVIWARKGLWADSARDLKEAGDFASANRLVLLPEQKAVLRRIFDLFSYAPHSFGEATLFRRALNEIRPSSLQNEIRSAILWSLPFTIGAALVNRHFRNVFRFARVYFLLGRPLSVSRNILSPEFFREGVGLLQGRRRVVRSAR